MMNKTLIKEALLAQADAHAALAYAQSYSTAITNAVAREFQGKLPDSYNDMRDQIEVIVSEAVRKAINETRIATELRKEAELLDD